MKEHFFLVKYEKYEQDLMKKKITAPELLLVRCFNFSIKFIPQIINESVKEQIIIHEVQRLSKYEYEGERMQIGNVIEYRKLCFRKHNNSGHLQEQLFPEEKKPERKYKE